MINLEVMQHSVLIELQDYLMLSATHSISKPQQGVADSVPIMPLKHMPAHPSGPLSKLFAINDRAGTDGGNHS